MATERTDLLQGTLDVLILKTLGTGAMHGWGIAQRIQQLSQDVLAVNQGSLYPRCTGSRRRAGSPPSGAARRTTGGRASTA
jgi:hypothetical protein